MGPKTAFSPTICCRPIRCARRRWRGRDLSVPVVTERYAFDESRDMKGPLAGWRPWRCWWLDGLIVLWLAGMFTAAAGRTARRRGGCDARWSLLVSLLSFPPQASAEDAKPGDAQAIDAISVTRLAYVITGDPSDRFDQPGRACRPVAFPDRENRARAGRAGRRRSRAGRTCLLSRSSTGRSTPNAAMPSEAAIARIDEYMKEGGTVLFDTRDQFATGIAATARPARRRSACATSSATSTCRRWSRCRATMC